MTIRGHEIENGKKMCCGQYMSVEILIRYDVT